MRVHVCVCVCVCVCARAHISFMQDKIITCKQLQIFQNVAHIKYLGNAVTQKSEQITCGTSLLPFNSKSFTFLSLSKDLKIKIHKNYKTRGYNLDHLRTWYCWQVYWNLNEENSKMYKIPKWVHCLHSLSVIMEIKSKMRCLRHKAGVHKPKAPGYSGDYILYGVTHISGS